MNGLFITGTDTDVGKSIVSAALLRAALKKDYPLQAINPIQTGVTMPPLEGDEALYTEAIQDICPTSPPVSTLCSFQLPASPHFAAAQEEKTVNVAKISRIIKAQGKLAHYL